MSAVKGKFDRSVSMLSWAYNEELLIEDFLDKAFSLLESTVEDFELVLVDDGSTDKTPKILARYADKEPRLRVLTNSTNRNVGYSAKRAMASASKDFLFWQTVDWSYDLIHLRIFLELLNYFDVVIGIRPYPERLLTHIPVIRSFFRVRTRSDNFAAAFVSLSNYYIIRILYGMPFYDFQNVQIYPTELVQSFDIRSNSSFVNGEIMANVYRRGASFIEVPIKFIPRSAGEAKGIKLGSLSRSIKEVFGGWVKWGWKFRYEISKDKTRRVFRTNEPYFLDEEVLGVIIPLFKEWRE